VAPLLPADADAEQHYDPFAGSKLEHYQNGYHAHLHDSRVDISSGGGEASPSAVSPRTH
jgi:hypothetical protein